MGSEIASPSVTQTNKPKRPLMPNNLLKAAIEGNGTDLRQLLGLNDEQPPPHTNVSVQDGAPTELSESDLLRSIAGMEDTILHILSANDHHNLLFTICTKDRSLLKACNARNETPFHHAARFGHKKTILELIRCAKLAFSKDELKELLRQKNCNGETTLHEAARHGHEVVVSTLMEEDVQLAGLVNNDSVSPLYLATARGSLEMVHNMVAKMLNHEITPSFYSGPKHLTALHDAVLKNPELTKEVLRLYSEPLGKGADETGRTPLHFVASTGNHKIAELLLDKDPSSAYIPDSDRSFPVHTAVQMGHVKMIVLFLQRCLDSGQLLDGNGRNFLHIAIEAKKERIIFELLKDSKNKLSISHWKKMFNKMINIMDNKGNTPLHLAAEHGYVTVLHYLLENIDELDLTLQNKEGQTAFDMSVIRLRKSARNTEDRDIFGEFYIQIRGGSFQYYTKEKMSEMELIRSTNEDHISTTEKREAKKSSEILMAKAQLVGLGSVLIATVTFAAAFTLPGGTNQNTGTPILGRKYLFKAFVLADFFAFALSFIPTMFLVYSSSDDDSDTLETFVTVSIISFSFAASCMLMALALGLYLVLAPIGHTGAVVLSISLLLITLYTWNPFRFNQQMDAVDWEDARFGLLRLIPEGASGSDPKDFKNIVIQHNKRILARIAFLFGAHFLAPFIVIFLFALI